MKPSLKFLVLGSSLLISIVTSAAEMSDLKIGGNGCVLPTGSHQLKPISDSLDRFSIPLNLSTAKASAESLQRKSCNMALVVNLDANERLIVSDISQKVKFRVGAQSKAQARLEVFLSGQTGEALLADVVANKSTIRKTQSLIQDGVVAVSECGKDTIVRANSSAIAQGAAKVTVDSQALELSLQIVPCDDGEIGSGEISN